MTQKGTVEQCKDPSQNIKAATRNVKPGEKEIASRGNKRLVNSKRVQTRQERDRVKRQ